MKKALFLILCLLLLVGCSMNDTTPTKAVESYLAKYQNLDASVTTQLDNVISNNISMNDEEKAAYRELMINQYKNLSYKITDEIVGDDRNEAEVDVTIEVLDYASNISESKIYYKNHLDEFKDSTSNDEELEETKSFIKYKIDNMKNVVKTRKYDMTFYLTKIDKEWVIDDLSDSDYEKLHGLYEE